MRRCVEANFDRPRETARVCADKGICVSCRAPLALGSGDVNDIQGARVLELQSQSMEHEKSFPQSFMHSG